MAELLQRCVLILAYSSRPTKPIQDKPLAATNYNPGRLVHIVESSICSANRVPNRSFGRLVSSMLLWSTFQLDCKSFLSLEKLEVMRDK